MSSTAGPSSQSIRPFRPIRAWGDEATMNNRDPGRMVSKTYRRSRSGCYTCRLRRKKCDENHPTCGACSGLGVSCEYRKPSWWISIEARHLQKEQIKNKIRETKVMEKEVALQEYIRHALPSPANPDQGSTIPSTDASTYDTSTSYLPTPTSATLVSNTYGLSNIADNNAFMPDASLLKNPTSATLSAMGPPPPPTSTTTTPSLHSEEWYQGFSDPPARIPRTPLSAPAATGPPSGFPTSTSAFPTRPLSFYLEAKMSRTDRERSLLYHFVDNVLRLVFPILDLHKEGPSRSREILHSLDTNKSYYHCCLSVSAIHLKTIGKNRGKRVDKDIMRHRYAAVSELCKALNADNGHDTILDATLAMIFFHCSVGGPDDGLPDIPWNEHFTAVTNLVNKLELVEPSPYEVLPFSMSLSTWIDILGATMLGKSPQFAHSYRTKHLSGISSGLRELMGCDDRIMYLISEIACLDSLKGEGRLDDFAICHHVSALTAQLDHAEKAADPAIESPMSASGIVQADKLTKNMTAIFRIAARIYLYSLLPGFEHNEQSIVELVESVANTLQFIPTGPLGFDRSLVWPMLITGAFSTPSSTFRTILSQRSTALGECSDFGSFGRMYMVLQEVWKLSEDISPSIYLDPGLISTSSSFQYAQASLPSPSIDTIGCRIKKQPIHWRETMKRHEWRYLLI